MGTRVPISPNNAVERFDRAILSCCEKKAGEKRKADDNLPFSDIKAWGM